MSNIKLPPLPDPHCGPNYYTDGLVLFSDDQMQAYAGAAVEAALTERQGEAVPLFLLHAGQIDSGGEQDDWEIEADSGKAVDEFCRKYPGQTIKLYAGPQPAPAQQPLSDERANFEIELRKQCFQKPTPEAYDLAWSMWQARAQKGTT